MADTHDACAQKVRNKQQIVSETDHGILVRERSIRAAPAEFVYLAHIVFGSWVKESFGPLHWAIYKNDHENLLSLLLNNDKSSSLGQKGWWYYAYHGETPLHLAATMIRGNNMVLIKTLLDHGANIDAKDVHELTPLHYAALMGNHEATKMLLDHGADSGARDSRTLLPLHLCCITGSVETLDVLLNHTVKGSVNCVAEVIGTPLSIACVFRHLTLIERLLKVQEIDPDFAPPPPLMTPLNAVCQWGNVDAIKMLVDHGAKINGDKARRNNRGSARFLSEMDAWATPLIVAARYGHLDAIKFLLGCKADVNTGDRWQITPLHAAVDQGHHVVTKMLLDHGAKVDAPAGCEAIFYGYIPPLCCTENGHAVSWDTLVERREVIIPLSGGGAHPLHVAATWGHTNIIESLLDHKADIAATMPLIGKKSLMAIHLAADRNQVSATKILLRRGANVNATWSAGDESNTALHMAVNRGNKEMVRVLLTHGASDTIRDISGLTPSQLAIRTDQRSIVCLFTALPFINLLGLLFLTMLKRAQLHSDTSVCPLHPNARSFVPHTLGLVLRSFETTTQLDQARDLSVIDHRPDAWTDSHLLPAPNRSDGRCGYSELNAPSKGKGEHWQLDHDPQGQRPHKCHGCRLKICLTHMVMLPFYLQRDIIKRAVFSATKIALA